jgi:hypothetical protein
MDGLYLHPDNASLLVSADGKLTADPACCCGGGGTCSCSVELTLDWSNNADLDLYGQVDSAAACYFGSLSAGGLTLSRDAHPVCSATPPTPEIITGSFTGAHTLRFWFNQYSNCLPEQQPSTNHLKITNTGVGSICVNSTTVAPGGSYESDTLAYGGYGTGAIPGFANPTVVQVSCGHC